MRFVTRNIIKSKHILRLLVLTQTILKYKYIPRNKERKKLI